MILNYSTLETQELLVLCKGKMRRTLTSERTIDLMDVVYVPTMHSNLILVDFLNEA